MGNSVFINVSNGQMSMGRLLTSQKDISISSILSFTEGTSFNQLFPTLILEVKSERVVRLI